MHYLTGVILPFDYEGEKLQEAIGEILEPWDGNDGDNPEGRWDWWQLGGRWTGIWSGYKPEDDPRNYESCWLCGGTGQRNDALGRQFRAQNPEFTCNGCSDGPEPGIRLKWPTQWAAAPDLDRIPVASLLTMEDAQLPRAIVAAPDVWLEKETWNGEDFVECPDWPAVVRAALETRRDMFIAAVDVHS